MSASTIAPSLAAGGLDAARSVACYEMLRERLTGQRLTGELLRSGNEPTACAPEVRALGLALLLDEGLPAWLHAIAPALRAAPTAGPHAAPSASLLPAGGARIPGPGLASDLIPAARQHDVAMLLANLVLSTRRAVHASSAHPDHGGARC